MKFSVKNRLAAFLLRLIGSTWRIALHGKFPDKPAIIAFWHGYMLPVWRLFSGKNAVGVVSLSKDGELLSSLLASWGYRLIRGSSSQKGKEVMKDIVDSVRDNYVLITPDGPTGPVYKFKAGAVVAAFRTGDPLYLCNVKMGKSIKFKSWDGFRLPLPFSKTIVEFSNPLYIPGNATADEINNYIFKCESIMNEPRIN